MKVTPQAAPMHMLTCTSATAHVDQPTYLHKCAVTGRWHGFRARPGGRGRPLSLQGLLRGRRSAPARAPELAPCIPLPALQHWARRAQGRNPCRRRHAGGGACVRAGGHGPRCAVAEGEGGLAAGHPTAAARQPGAWVAGRQVGAASVMPPQSHMLLWDLPCSWYLGRPCMLPRAALRG